MLIKIQIDFVKLNHICNISKHIQYNNYYYFTYYILLFYRYSKLI